MEMSGKKLGILVGGGPAPGINGVIGAATIRANLAGVSVVGIQEGYHWLLAGDVGHTTELTIDAVSRIHWRGGSILGTSRDNPTKEKKRLEATVASLVELGIDKLISIGGDDTAYSAMKVEEMAAGRIRVVHVPKTIDNDLDLPNEIPTFGYQTARHIGVELARSLMVDAKTTARWYFVVSMGRKAGHLALGIGRAAGATITIIPEEFPDGRIALAHVVDILVGAIVKRLSHGRSDGVAVLAEGLVERFDTKDLESLDSVERDAHGHIRIAEVDFGDIVKREVQARLKKFGISLTIADKEIGYELRSADPIPFDMDYTRDLGFAAVQFLLDGGNAAMVSIQDGRFVPMYFKDILDPATGRTRVRMVDVGSEYYAVARRYMLRLGETDFADPQALAKLAAVCGISPDEFRAQFSHLSGGAGART